VRQLNLQPLNQGIGDTRSLDEPRDKFEQRKSRGDEEASERAGDNSQHQ
jgi:hypothetical protein